MTKSNFVKHTNCDNCGSSNANSLYDDGHTYCFVCETYKNEDGSIELNKKETKPMNKDLKFYDNATSNAISNRGISQTTCLTYGVKQDPHGNKHYYPYFDADGVMVAIKTRDVPTKNFSISGEFKDATLFGQQLFAKGGRTLTICEGEADALASYQIGRAHV